MQVLPGELTEPCFGLGQAEFQNLAAKVTAIYHCAATTGLNEDLEVARKVNVGGTTNVLALAAESVALGGAPRLFHVSTAYVAGLREGVCLPDELSFAAGFKNAYEQTKAEAEALVRDFSTRVPTLIFRPSIIVGDSVSGQASAFNVIYVPAKLLIRGLFRCFPANPNAPVDVVPVDYVADAIAHLSKLPLPSGTCYHLTVGLGRETTPWELLEAFYDAYNRYRKKGPTVLAIPPFVPPELLSFAYQSFTAARSSFQAIERVVATKLNVFRQAVPSIPYMLANPRFDSGHTSSVLGEELAPPVFLSYAETVFRYCFETNFGRRPWQNPANLPTWHRRVKLD